MRRLSPCSRRHTSSPVGYDDTTQHFIVRNSWGADWGDQGYFTITPDHHVLVSKRIREEFENGRDYYALDGKPVKVLPDLEKNRPAPEFLQWHNEQIYLG